MFSLLALVACSAVCHAILEKVHERDTIYASFGDCVAWGSIATPKETNSYSALTAAFLNRLYPKTTLVNCGIIAATAQDYVNSLPPMIPKIAELTKKYGPMTRASLLVGTGDLQNNKDPHVDQTKASMQYKAELQTMITAILKLNPSCQLVLCTNFDQNNAGKGSMAPYPCPGLIKEFNKRIFELGDENHLPIADLYTVMMGHPEYYVPTDTHPNTDGHAVIASVLEGIFDTSPGAHQPKPNATPTPGSTAPTMATPTPEQPDFETFWLGSKKNAS